MAYLLVTDVYKFSKNLRANSKFYVPAG